MTDYKSLYVDWLNTLRQFVDRVDQLPGESQVVEFTVAKPLSDNDANKLNESLPFGLHESIRSFLVHACGGFSLAYVWQPPSNRLNEIQAVFPHCCFGNQSSLGIASLRFLSAECITENHAEGSWRDQLEYFPNNSDLLSHSFPFADTATGDILALDLRYESPPVVYMRHDLDEEFPVIAESFVDFLMKWQSVYYLEPIDIRWNLGFEEQERCLRLVSQTKP